MNRLPLPKEEKEKKPWTTWRQLKYGLCAFGLGLLLTDITDNAIYRMLGIWGYAASFSIIPVVPEYMTKKSVINKYKRNLRIFAVIMIIFAVSSYMNTVSY
ncbi:MAG: hypothetical protein R3Y63_08185 [Eubacteriales bacterium]